MIVRFSWDSLGFPGAAERTVVRAVKIDGMPTLERFYDYYDTPLWY
jgi:hypothetical protein